MSNFLKEKKIIKEVSPIDQMGEASFPVIPFPFNGQQVMCKVRCLNRTQLMAIGEFNLIDIRSTDEINKSEGVSSQEVIEAINSQEALVRETLINPTFEEIESKLYGQDNRITGLKEKLNIIREKIKEVPACDRKALSKEADAIELYIGSLLPNDFMDAVTSWATGSDRSDIKKITREMLLKAAILATRGGDNPADHMDGNFLDIHYDMINESSWIVYNQFEEEKRIEKGGDGVFKGMKVTRGGEVRR